MHKLVGKTFVQTFSCNMTFHNFFRVVSETDKTFEIAPIDKRQDGGESFFPIVVPSEFVYHSEKKRVRKSNLHPSGTGFFFKNKSYYLYNPEQKYTENHLD